MRNQRIDSMKGFAIILVVLGHIIQNTDSNFDENIFFRLIYSFHMPLFFFLSGFVSKNEITSKIIKKYFFALIIPFISWAVIAPFYLATIRGGQYEGIFNNIYHTLVFPDNGLWYLYVLFAMHILTWIEFKTSILFVIVTLFSMILISYLINNGNFLGLKTIVFHAPFFYFGRLFLIKDNLIGKFCAKYKVLILLLFFCFAFNWYRDHINIFSVNLNSVSIYLYKYWVAFLAILGIYGAFSSFELNKLAFLGRKTLVIYVLNAYFMPFIGYLILPYYYTISTIVSCALICFISISIGVILNKNKLLSLLLLGKNKYNL